MTRNFHIYIYGEVRFAMEKSLGKRLLCVAQSVPKCGSVVDCGCDHGHVSIYIAKNAIAERVTASDINRGPLDNAEREIAAARLTGRITTVLTDGLDGISPHDCVVIAGMGGETIADIIARAPWTKGDCTLVLQPMTRIEMLREYLYREGFSITKECFVEEGGHMYCVITSCFTGAAEYKPFEKYISRAALSDTLAARYTDIVLSRLRYEFERKIAAGVFSDEEKRKVDEDIRSIEEMRKTL